MGVENLVFEGEDRNDKVEDENEVIKDKEQVELRVVISDDLPFIVVISRRQRSKEADNNTRRYNLKRSAKGIR